MIAFGKYQGLGNDFLVVDLRAAGPGLARPDATEAAAVQDPAIVRALCDRQFGVGGDGVLAILPATTPGSDARMRVLNADGGEAEMCGNGLRCVVKYLRERGGVETDRITVDTGAGALACDVHRTGDLVDAVTVDMGRPRLTRGEIPMTGPSDERVIDVPLAVDAGLATPVPGTPHVSEPRTLRATAVSMGNPHAVFFVDDVDLMDLAMTVGPGIEVHPWFPRKTNVELARMRSRQEIDLVVWERGCGITLACGTGACATAVAACLNGHAAVGDELAVNLPGGTLAIRVATDYRTVLMRGPAAHVFDGSVDAAAVVATRRPGTR